MILKWPCSVERLPEAGSFYPAGPLNTGCNGWMVVWAIAVYVFRLQFLQPRPKRRRVHARPGRESMVNRVVNWCWTAFSTVLNLFSSSQDNNPMPHRGSDPMPHAESDPIPHRDTECILPRQNDLAIGEGCDNSHLSNGNNSQPLSAGARDLGEQSAVRMASAHGNLFSPVCVAGIQGPLLDSRKQNFFTSQHKASPLPTWKTSSSHKCSIQASTPLPKTMKGTRSSARLRQQHELPTSVKYVPPTTVKQSSSSSVNQLHSFCENQFPFYPTTKHHPSVKPPPSISMISTHPVSVSHLH